MYTFSTPLQPTQAEEGKGHLYMYIYYLWSHPTLTNRASIVVETKLHVNAYQSEYLRVNNKPVTFALIAPLAPCSSQTELTGILSIVTLFLKEMPFIIFS